MFKVVKEWNGKVAVYFSMARTGNGNANAVVYMAQENENESFSGAIEEMPVLNLFPAERTAISNDSLAVAVASMNAWILVKKKGSGGRDVEAEMRAAAAAAKEEREELAEKENNAASESEQAKALKDKEKAKKKAPALVVYFGWACWWGFLVGLFGGAFFEKVRNGNRTLNVADISATATRPGRTK